MWTSNVPGSIPVPLGYTEWLADGVAKYYSGNADKDEKGGWTASDEQDQTNNPPFKKLTSDDGTISCDGTPSYGYPTWCSVVVKKK